MHRSLIAATLAAATLGACGPIEDTSPDGTPTALGGALTHDGARILADRVRVIDGARIRMQKLAVDGQIVARYLSADGEVIPPEALPTPPRFIIEPRLAAELDRLGDRDEIAVRVGLVAPPAFDADDPDHHGSHAFDDGGRYAATLDGDPLTLLGEATSRELRAARTAELRAERRAWRAERWQTLAEQLDLDPRALAAAIDEGARSAELRLTRRQIEALADAEAVALIERPEPRADSLSAAMRATGADPVVLRDRRRQGDGIGVFFSESGCPRAGDVDDYRRLGAASATTHSRRVARILRGVAPLAFLYCRASFRLPTSADLDGVGDDPAVLVENHSWTIQPLTTDGMAHGDTRYISTDRDFDDHVYEDGIAVFVAAGNGGTARTDGVATPAKALNVTAVGNYDDGDDEINRSSSWREPETGNRKPELSAPGTNIRVAGLSGTGTGTSFASPHAAALAADLMGAYPWLQLRPHYLAGLMIAGATDEIAGGFDRVGFGGIDMQSAYFSGIHFWWNGRNDSFTYFDARDADPLSDTIDREFYVDAERFDTVRVALRWLTRGSYTYAHRHDAHPIGRDLDLAVYDPNGRLIGASFSWDDPFEVITFAPVQSGTYTARIHDYANRDEDLRIKMGLSVNYD